MAEIPEKGHSRSIGVGVIFGLFVLAFIILFFLFKCNGGGQSEAYNSIRDSLDKVLKEKEAVIKKAEGMGKDIQQLDTALADAIADRDLMQESLLREGDRATILEAQLKKAKADKDTVEIVRLADSCCSVNSFLRERYKAAISGQKATDSLYVLRVKKADSLSNHWETEYRKCLSAVASAANELPRIKPTGKLYIDVTGQTGALTALGGGLGYMDKHGRLINVDYLISGHGPLYQLRLSAPLNFKRK